METAVKNGGDEMWDYVDLESLVRYVMCFNIACNQELNHPKSVYLYTVNGGKFEFGPIWDFDWAYGFEPMYTKTDDSGDWGWGGGWGTTYPSYENPLLGTQATTKAMAASFSGHVQDREIPDAVCRGVE